MRHRERAAKTLAFDFLTVIGFATALVLLAAWPTVTRPAQAEALEDGAPPGALVFRSASGEETFAAPLLSTDVSFRVAGMVARARVVQTFRNPRDDWYEGVYVFPLPEKAAVDQLRMRVGERVIEGEIRERAEARRVYDQARASGQRAALMDQERPNIFTTRVANIAPQATVVVELEYQQTLRYADGQFSLRFPMVVGPRYIPGNLRVAGAAGEGWAQNTDRVPDAARITPPVLHPDRGSINPVTLRVELDAGVPVAALSSPYHRVRVEALGPARHTITLADGTTPANRDFELVWTPRAGTAPQAAWFVEERDGRHYGLLMLLPPTAQSARLPREVVFVLDTSGSMAGASIRQAKEALEAALERLTPQDRFNVIEFNSTATRLFAAAREATPANRRGAIEWVRALKAQGGTEMAAALHLALDGGDAAERVRQVIFLTDGAVGNEEELFALIGRRLGGSRLFTVGIGSAPNSHFMTKAAQLGRGTFTYIGRIEEVREKMNALFARLESPVLKQLELEWPDGVQAEAWPQRIPDLYAGEPVVVVAALDRTRGEARVNGLRDGERWEARVPLERGSGASGMGSLWAREKVSALMDSIREGAPEAEVRTRVIELATAHRLVTKYTSFVAVDRAPARPADAALKLAAVPTNLPEGWEYEKVFGELPRGSTDSRFAMLTGLAAMLLAALTMLGRAAAEGDRMRTRASREVALGVECAWPDGVALFTRRRESLARRRLRIAVAAALLALGAWQFGHGAWIQAKAWLAQALMARAWERTLAGERQVKPWPWADTWPVARLSVPSSGVERYVLAGSEGATIAFGPGHVLGTAVPGSPGNSVIGGHRDTHLAFLRELRVGTPIEVEAQDGARQRYAVRDAQVLDRREIWIAKQEGPTRLTLVTCWPFDALRAGGPLRYVVWAYAIEDAGPGAGRAAAASAFRSNAR